MYTKVTKKFGFFYVVLRGTPRAIDMLTRIHAAYGRRGYGIVLPGENDRAEIALHGVGSVMVINENKKDGDNGKLYTVEYIGGGGLRGWLKSLFE